MTRLDDELVGLLKYLGDPAADYILDGEQADADDIDEQLECGHCKGTGVDPLWDDGLGCGVCHGTGTVDPNAL